MLPMNYTVFHARCIGAAHIRKNLPCQDYCCSREEGDFRIAVVADGHGNRKHFRSDRGSRIACEKTEATILEFLNLTAEISAEQRSQLAGQLKEEICRRWRAAVLEDIAADPWHPEELSEQQALLPPEQYTALVDGKGGVLAYGCTLCAVFSAPWGWGAVQVGDGCVTVIDRDGSYRWPMPESALNHGHFTASLCAANPMEDFRHVFGSDFPAGLMVYSDGIEKVFPEQGSQIVSFLHWVWQNRKDGSEDAMSALTGTLERLTAGSRIGDDISIAGLVDPNAPDVTPAAAPGENLNRLHTLEAQLQDLQSSITYNRRCLETAGDGQTAEQIRAVLARREPEAAQLREEIDRLRAAAGMPPLPVEPSPAPQEPCVHPVPEEASPTPSPAEPVPAEEDAPDAYFWDTEPENAPTIPVPDPPHEQAPASHKAQPSLTENPVLKEITKGLHLFANGLSDLLRKK